MAKRRTRHDLVEVTVLALLLQQPRHPYDLHRFILDTRKDFISGLPRSLYHAVDRLAEGGLVEPLETVQEGRRPERTVYGITEEGKAELGTRLRHMLEYTRTDMKVLSAALSLMGALPAGEVIRSLRSRAATLEGMVLSADSALSGLRDGGLPRLLLLEVEYDRAMRAAELEWIRALLTDMHTGEITWPGLMDGPGDKEAKPTDTG